MKATSFLHQSDSRYCFSLDERRVLVRLAVNKEEKIRGVNVVYGEDYRFGTHHIEIPMRDAYEDADFRYYEAILENDRPSFLYVFRVYDQHGKGYYLSETGLSEGYMADLSFISAYQIDGENEADYVLDKPSWAGRVFYNIFPDRFAIGDPSQKKPYVNIPWDAKDLKRGGKFAGGDLQGVTNKLEYLKSLGIGAIYLNPICSSPSYHKYDVTDYFHVDPMFGGDEAFFALVKKARELDIKIMLDLVFNHTSSEHPFFKDCIKNGKKSPYYEFYFIDGDRPNLFKKNYRTFAAVSHMPKLNTSNEKVIEYLISVGEYWLRKGADGFRLDVSQGVSHAFWNRFKIALKKIDPEVLLIGENWLNCESYLGPDELDGVMDYPFLGIMSGYALRQKSAQEVAWNLNASLMRYKDGNNRMMLRLLSSHDIQRFMNLCRNDRGPYMCCYAVLYFFLGYPMLYYGDEILMVGGGDPDCRRPMQWDSPAFEGAEFEAFKALGKLRQEEALRKGDIEIKTEGSLLKIIRNYGEKRFILLTNLSGKSVPLPHLPLHYGYRVAARQVADGGFAVLEE